MARQIPVIVIVSMLAAGVAVGQQDRDFSGSWRLDRGRSSINDKTVAADSAIRVEQSATSLKVFPESTDAAIVQIYPLDGRLEEARVGDRTLNTATKWEGAALLVNTIVSGTANYSIAERWSRSRDGNTLTITRNIVRVSGETESILIYSSGGETSSSPKPEQTPGLVPRSAPASPIAAAEYVVAAGTHILLRLTNAVNTKHSAAGDRIYLQTAVPVFVNGRVIIPEGSYVNGTIAESKEAGRVKGKSELTLRYDSITLRSGASRDLRSRPDSVDTKGNLDRTEGRIEGDGNKAGDAGKVARTTAAGTGIGAVVGSAAGHVGAGAGIGAAGGAVAGLARVFGSRGPEVVLPAGTTMDMALDRDLRFTDEDLRVR